MRSRLAWLITWGFGLVFFLNLPNYAFREGGLGVPPLLTIGAFLALAACFADRLLQVSETPIWRVSLAFSLLAALSFLWSAGGPRAWQTVEDTVLGLLYVTGWLLVLSEPSARRALPAVLLAGILAAAGMNVYELFHPQSISNSFGRAAGTFLNPNLAAQAVVVAMAFLLSRVRSFWTSSLVIFASGVAVAPTFSRGGAILAVLLVCVWLAGVVRRRPGLALAAAGVVAATLGAAVAFMPAEALEVSQVAVRLEQLSGGELDDEGASSRMLLASQGVDLFLEKPLLGHGAGRSEHIQLGTTFLGTHNEYLSAAVNYGLLGVIVLGAYFFAILRERPRLVALFLIGNALFFHDMLLNRQLLLVVALTETLIFCRRSPAEEPELGLQWQTSSI